MTEVVYRVSGVQRRHGESTILQVDELRVSRNEVLCLLGPTGAGKSTLLRLLAGVELPSQGEIAFEGEPMEAASLSIARRRVTLVFQRPMLLAGTVRVNVEYGLRLRGESRAGCAPRVDRTLARLGLSRLAHRSARTLSGGETQLVAIARALVLEPQVLLLDEPTAQLDPAHVALIEQVIEEDHRERGTTIVWATHNLFQARRVAGRVGLLLDGRLVEVAPTETFFESPSDPRTTAFVRGELIY